MLFNSYAFLLGFLPAVLLGYYWFGRAHKHLAAAFLTLSSLAFYGWWDVRYVPLLIGSISINYVIGTVVSRAVRDGWRLRARALLVTGIVINLSLLGYYKYANFFVDNLNVLASSHWHLPSIILPLGISFFTFTQIAFLADAYQGKAQEYNPVHYALFVTYFPHLIAGPILHHKEMMPQFGVASNYRLQAENFAVGFTIFAIGLFKKVVLADGIAPYATDSFSAAAAGERLAFFQAWGGVLAYTLQLYFDFSGYSDMAIGLSRLFGIVLPLNFNSPYKAANIIDFWRRWHMTLSRFLRDYLYIPLGGNRHGAARRYLSLFLTMLLGGLWHGAGWTFVLWGALHGAYLMLNHAWRAICARSGWAPSGRMYHVAAVGLTFLAVVVGWTFFRAPTIDAALLMLRGMAGLHGVLLPGALGSAFGPAADVLQDWGVRFDLGGGASFVKTYLWVLLLLSGVFLTPNTQELLAAYRPALDFNSSRSPSRLAWRPTRSWALGTALIGAMGILSLTRYSEFLYFQF